MADFFSLLRRAAVQGGGAPPAGKLLAYGGQAGYVRWAAGAGQFGGQAQAGPCLLVGSRMVLVWTKCA